MGRAPGELSGDMEIFYILMAVVITWVYTLTKILHSISLCVHFIKIILKANFHILCFRLIRFLLFFSAN